MILIFLLLAALSSGIRVELLNEKSYLAGKDTIRMRITSACLSKLSVELVSGDKKILVWSKTNKKENLKAKIKKQQRVHSIYFPIPVIRGDVADEETESHQVIAKCGLKKRVIGSVLIKPNSVHRSDRLSDAVMIVTEGVQFPTSLKEIHASYTRFTEMAVQLGLSYIQDQCLGTSASYEYCERIKLFKWIDAYRAVEAYATGSDGGSFNEEKAAAYFDKHILKKLLPLHKSWLKQSLFPKRTKVAAKYLTRELYDYCMTSPSSTGTNYCVLRLVLDDLESQHFISTYVHQVMNSGEEADPVIFFIRRMHLNTESLTRPKSKLIAVIMLAVTAGIAKFIETPSELRRMPGTLSI